MAKGIYVGVSGDIKKTGNIIPTTWTKVSNTKYTASDGTILTSSTPQDTTTLVVEACDGNETNYFASSAKVAEGYVQIEFPEPKKITKIKTRVAVGVTTYLSYVQVQGSNDGTSWTLLRSLSSSMTEMAEITFVSSNVNYYKYYRIYALHTAAPTDGTSLTVYEWQTTEYAEPQTDKARKVKKIYVGVETQPVLINNDFSNGLEGWTLTNMAEQSIEQENGINVLKFKPNATSIYSRRILKTFEYEASHIYYASASLKSEGNTASDSTTNAYYEIYFGGMQIAGGYEPTTQWKKFSGRGKMADGRFYVSAQDAGAYYMYIKDVSFYDLTAMFGSGNEPDITWCDANLSNNSYIGKKARKVKSGYIGVNGIAQLFYSTETKKLFTSSPAPTTWTDSSNYKSATATNEYGQWRVSANRLGGVNGYRRVSYAFDANTGSNYNTGGYDNIDQACYVYLTPPKGVSIKPTSIFVKHEMCGSTNYRAYVQAYYEGKWFDLSRLGRFNVPTEQNLEITTDTYYTDFRLLLYTYNNDLLASSIYEFQITSGTIKIEG